jgi:hypothetical protein
LDEVLLVISRAIDTTGGSEWPVAVSWREHLTGVADKLILAATPDDGSWHQVNGELWLTEEQVVAAGYPAEWLDAPLDPFTTSNEEST